VDSSTRKRDTRKVMSSRVSRAPTIRTKTAKPKNSTTKRMTKAAKSTSTVRAEASARREPQTSRVVTKMENLPRALTRNKLTSIMSTSLTTATPEKVNSERRNTVEAALFTALIMVLINTVCWDTKKTANSTNISHIMCLFTKL
jgi:ferric-dicitrate binding protein FerR (iron transport regulator)